MHPFAFTPNRRFSACFAVPNESAFLSGSGPPHRWRVIERLRCTAELPDTDQGRSLLRHYVHRDRRRNVGIEGGRLPVRCGH